MEGMEERLRRTELGQDELIKRMDASDANQAEIIRQLRELGAGIQQLRSEDSGDERNYGEGRMSGASGSNGNQGGAGVGDVWGRQLEIPTFSGLNAYAWLSKVERYFQVNEVGDGEKVGVVMLVLEGEALSWYQWWELSNPIVTWNGFRREILGRFQPSMLDNPYGPLYALKQNGTVAEFRAEFEAVVGTMRYADEEVLKGAWLSGLRGSIREEVLMNPGLGLSSMMKLAHKIDIRNASWTEEGFGFFGPKNYNGPTKTNFGPKSTPLNVSASSNYQKGNSEIPKSNLGRTMQPESPQGSVAGSRVTEAPKSKFRRLSDAESQERRRLGLCFKCNKKWGPEHKCTARQLHLLIVDEDLGDPSAAEDENLSVTAEQLKNEEDMALQLTLQSLMGISSNQSMKVWGVIDGRSVEVLIDCRASSNFVKQGLVDHLGLTVESTPTYSVEIGNGHKISCQGVCRGVAIAIQGSTIVQDLFLFDLGGADVVLGLDWLRELGEIKANFRELTIKYVSEGHEAVIKGDPTLSKTISSLKSMAKALEQEGQGYFVQWEGSAASQNFQEEWKELDDLLVEFGDIFAEAKGFPPKRSQDHAIVLKPGTQPCYIGEKKDGSWRVCVDYRALNKITVPDKFPLPVVDELLDEVGGSKVFSKLDLKSRFNQIRMNVGDIPKTAFRTHEGHYEYLVMPFGLTNAPSTFQALMNDVLKPHLRKFALVEYLGHIVTEEGVKADPVKIKAMEDWPVPRNVKGLRGHLGLTGYYRKFVKDYGKIARPLTDLLKKDAFKWGEGAHVAFAELKKLMPYVPILALPNFSKTFVVVTDAYGKGIGVVLMQEDRPLAYISRGFSQRAMGKSVYEKELMAVVFAVQKWRPYLLGRHFIPGKGKVVADALSRKEEFLLLSKVQLPHLEEIDKEVQADNRLRGIIQNLLEDPASHPGFQLHGGRLFFKDRLVLSKSSRFISSILSEFHDSCIGGHSGFSRTFKRMVGVVFWEGMRKTVQQYVLDCAICQQNKIQNLSPAGLLQPLPIPSQIWTDVSMDFIGGLPKAHGVDTIFVVVDRLTKFAHFIPLAHPYSAKEVAELFVREVVWLHGFPSTIVSNRDRVFQSHFWSELFKSAGTKLQFTTAYHPQSNGQSEVVNRSLETYL
ncbi:uncharacterized protein LOC133289385 [Gastrolobium bilobum]|uniref:uncharacterized protein LOC133289385 n=1 Tax=Gastrolobium bilobum TaxID=150636 RepID=UPI002AB11FFB|nr:uncharacterized protein LOC133289385 [Gastrolobium bilobum]